MPRQMAFADKTPLAYAFVSPVRTGYGITLVHGSREWDEKRQMRRPLPPLHVQFEEQIIKGKKVGYVNLLDHAVIARGDVVIDAKSDLPLVDQAKALMLESEDFGLEFEEYNYWANERDEDDAFDEQKKARKAARDELLASRRRKSGESVYIAPPSALPGPEELGRTIETHIEEISPDDDDSRFDELDMTPDETALMAQKVQAAQDEPELAGVGAPTGPPAEPPRPARAPAAGKGSGSGRKVLQYRHPETNKLISKEAAAELGVQPNQVGGAKK